MALVIKREELALLSLKGISLLLTGHRNASKMLNGELALAK